ncbi:MAG TPA: glycosyl transferase, partial [Clostridia bacterium]|nr:glycosyl transferase [Clostridia bacterium]
RGSSIITEYFAKGTEPSSSDICDVHIKAKVDITSRDLYGRPLLANPYCPPSVVQEKVFIQRPVPYLPKDPSNLTLAKQIADWMYELPQGEYCTIHSAGTVAPAAPSTNSDPAAASTSDTPTLPSSSEDLTPLPDTADDVLP